MAKKALVIVAEGFEEIEAAASIDILRRAAVEVTVAGLTELTIKGSRGLWVLADKKLEESDADCDCIVLPGGSLGAAHLAASAKVASMIKKMYQSGKIVAAICASPALVLAPTGILENKSATCFPGMEAEFPKTTRFRDEAVVVDGTIITSRGPATAIHFALAIVEKLAGKETADKVKKATLAG